MQTKPYQAKPLTPLSIETLDEIASIQRQIVAIPDQESMLRFACRRLAMVPGTEQVYYRVFTGALSDDQARQEGQEASGYFPLGFNGVVHGALIFDLADPESFAPYVPYLANLSQTLGLLFQERHHRQMNETLKGELEQRVRERTRQLETEIDEQKRSQKYRDAIINNTRSVIYVKDTEGRYLMVNDRFCELANLGRDRIIGHLPTELFAGDPPRRHLENDRLVVQRGEGGTFSETLMLEDGRHEYISIKFPLFDDTGAVNAVGGISTDITELKNVENKLRLDEARLEALLQLFQMTDASMKDVTDFALEEAIRLTKSKIGYLAFTNADESLLTMYSWSQEAMRLCAIQDIQIEYAVAETGLWGEAIRQRRPIVTNDYQAPSKLKKGYPDGHVAVHRHMNVPVFEGARIVAVAGVGNKAEDYDDADVRQLRLLMQGMWRLIQRMKAADEKLELERKLRQAHKMESIGTLAGGIAHDFNNILSAILGYTELSLAETPPGTFVHGSLRNVLEAGKRARDLVRHILAFSRQGDQELIPIELHPMIKEVVKFMRASLPTSIKIRQNIKGAPIVMADPTQIHQVLMNLCTNAGQAMQDQGGVMEIGLETMELDEDFTGRHPGLQPGAHVRFTISDTGCGMSPEIMERIFDPFFTTKGRGEGTGMGLAVVHGIVKNHGGVITVYSTPGKGSVFNVFLPAIERRSKQELRPEKALVGGTERILFVDDEGPLVELGIAMLGSLGYRVSGSNSSTAALERFRRDPDQFDLVITDLTMPEMSGDRLAKELMQIRPDIPVILCTGFSASIDAETAMAMGIRAYVNKPILRRQFSETVRNVLDGDAI